MSEPQEPQANAHSATANPDSAAEILAAHAAAGTAQPAAGSAHAASGTSHASAGSAHPGGAEPASATPADPLAAALAEVADQWGCHAGPLIGPDITAYALGINSLSPWCLRSNFRKL